LEQNIQVLEQIVVKPFEKDAELSQLKTDVARLEREISIKIQTNQMKQHGDARLTVESLKTKVDDAKLKEAPIIRMDADNKKQNEKSLLVKKEFSQRRDKGLSI